MLRGNDLFRLEFVYMECSLRLSHHRCLFATLPLFADNRTIHRGLVVT